MAGKSLLLLLEDLNVAPVDTYGTEWSPARARDCMLTNARLDANDRYGTQRPLALLRELVEHGTVRDAGMFGRGVRVTSLVNVQYAGAMDAERGTISLLPRLLRLGSDCAC